MKFQNTADSSWSTMTKLVWQLGLYEPSSLYTKDLQISWCHRGRSTVLLSSWLNSQDWTKQGHLMLAFTKQSCRIQTSRTGDQWYSDSSTTFNCSFWPIILVTKFAIIGCGGGQVVSVLTFYLSDDPSSNPADIYSFFCKICVWKERK